MRKLYATIIAVAWIVEDLPAAAQTPVAATAPASGPTWADPENWKAVQPVETANIVYATVPHIANPSA